MDTRDRQVVWAGFGALTFAALMSWVIVRCLSAAWPHQSAYDFVFGNTPRIVFSSMFAFTFQRSVLCSGKDEDTDKRKNAMDEDDRFDHRR
jgi:hypothetical protein